MGNEWSYLFMRSCRTALVTFAIALTVSACSPTPGACPACPACPAPPTASAAPPAPAGSALQAAAPTPSAGSAPAGAQSDARAGGAQSDAQASDTVDPYCHVADDDESYGGWEATPDEVTAAVRKMKFLCASTDWATQAIPDCMARLDKARVVVRAGVEGDRATQQSCDLAVATVKWNGRRWIALVNSVRDGNAFFGYITSVELTARGPVLSTTGCERDSKGMPGGALHPMVPPGWKTFPPEVQKRLCN
jgi:hypothetical protein